MRILLVEDEADVRQFLARALALIVPDVEVVPALDGAEALDRFRREPFDLIVSDHRMPNLTGLELLRSVRASSQIPFLLLTADRNVDAAALAAGANEVLAKPISLATLRQVITSYLGP